MVSHGWLRTYRIDAIKALAKREVPKATIPTTAGGSPHDPAQWHPDEQRWDAWISVNDPPWDRPKKQRRGDQPPRPTTDFQMQEELEHQIALDQTADSHDALRLQAAKTPPIYPTQPPGSWPAALKEAEGNPAVDIYATYGEDMLTVRVAVGGAQANPRTPLYSGDDQQSGRQARPISSRSRASSRSAGRLIIATLGKRRSSSSPAAADTPSSRILPSVIGGPCGCLGFSIYPSVPILKQYRWQMWLTTSRNSYQ